MKYRFYILRVSFFVSYLLGSLYIWAFSPNLRESYGYGIIAMGFLLGLLVVGTEFLLKQFSIRVSTSLCCGLIIGSLIAFLITGYFSPNFESPQFTFAYKLAVLLMCTYMTTAVALRENADFTLLIPFVRFVPHNADHAVIILDSTALIDGRIATICQSRFISSTLVVPKFVIQSLHRMADSEDLQQQSKGKKGVEALNKLKNMNYISIKIQDITLDGSNDLDAKLVYLTKSMKAKLMTTDYNLAKLAEFHGIEWLNINALSKALNPEVTVGQYLDIELVKPGKEPHQGVGYLPDGSMVVVNEAIDYIGQTVATEVISVLPSAGGKMIFARLHKIPLEVAA